MSGAVPNATRNGVQQRFFELRYDGDRKVSGVAMPYGNVAELPWGEKERFEPGAFGEVGGLDVILNMQHDRRSPLARSKGGGLVLTDSPAELRIEATLPDTRDADDTLTLIKKKILRGLSVEFLPTETRNEGDTLVIEKADLSGIGVVDRPAYSKTTVEARRALPKESSSMDEKQIRALIEEAVAKGEKIDPAELTKNIREMARAELDSALKTRDEETAARLAAEATAAEERAAAETAAKAVEDRHKAELAEVRVEVERVATLRSQFGSLMADGTDMTGKSAKDILILAVGKEVDKPEDRSEDYLLAKAEGIIERRGKAGAPQPYVAPAPGKPQDASAPVSILSMIEQRGIERAAGRGQ